jgi:hypothetical protein
MALGSTQPLTEMSTRNPLGGKGRPELKAANITVISEPIVCNSGLQPGVCEGILHQSKRNTGTA